MSLLVSCRKLLSAIVGRRYRPELHYMRGPGPKWLERHRIRLPDQQLSISMAWERPFVHTDCLEQGGVIAMPKQGQYSDAHLEGFLDTNAQDGITNAQTNRRRPKLVALGNITGKECAATDRQITGSGN